MPLTVQLLLKLSGCRVQDTHCAEWDSISGKYCHLYDTPGFLQCPMIWSTYPIAPYNPLQHPLLRKSPAVKKETCRCLRRIVPFAQAFALQHGSRNCHPAPELVLFQPNLPHVLFSGGVFFSQTISKYTDNNNNCISFKLISSSASVDSSMVLTILFPHRDGRVRQPLGRRQPAEGDRATRVQPESRREACKLFEQKYVLRDSAKRKC